MIHTILARRLAMVLFVSLGLATMATANESMLAKAMTSVAHNFTQFALDGAKAMPASDYDFRPTDDARSFGEIVAHLADANASLCSAIAGQGAAVDASIEKQTRKSPKSKDALVAALDASVEQCRTAGPVLDDAAMSRLVRFGGGELIDGRSVPPREMPLASLITLYTAHTSLHYGNMTTYLRLKGQVPPSSRGISAESDGSP